MVVIEEVIPQVAQQAGPTVCLPMSYAHTLTTVDNALYLGKLGFVMGVIACILFWVAARYAAPKIYVYGVLRGWW